MQLNVILYADRRIPVRIYDYSFLETTAIPSDIVSFLTQIHEFKGKQSILYNQQPDVLQALVEVAKIQSTGASNRIEGIHTTDKRLQILKGEFTPANRDEEEILGYRTVLDIIHESHDYIPINSNLLLQLHRDLYKFSSLSFGGKYKNSDNIIEETDAFGNKRVRFKPVSAFETPNAVDALCAAYTNAISGQIADPLLIDMLFVLDFLCIHPFIDGNGRMSRLITLLLLYKSNYVVGKYISIEALIEKTKDNYYKSLEQSSQNWHEGNNDIWCFIGYMLGVLLAAYRDFENRIILVASEKLTKEECIQKTVNDSIGLFSKSDIMEQCPDISMTTIEKVLGEMRKAGLIKTIGSGRGAKWCKIV